MNSIEVSSYICQINFLKYLSKFISDADISASPDIKNFTIIFNASDDPCITPSCGEFKWIDKINNNSYLAP